jgi:undecaprenyl-diphosphatase
VYRLGPGSGRHPSGRRRGAPIQAPRERQLLETSAPTLSRLHPSISRFDDAVDHLFTPLRGSRRADWAFYVASEAADYSVAWHLISAVIAIVSPRRRRHALRLAVVLGVESILVNGILKRFTRRDRPAMLDDRAYEVRRPKTSSFPSGHASSAAVATVLLSDAVPPLRPLWASLAAFVAASRVHNRMHHASDVAAGAVLGTVIGMVARKLWPLR